MNDSSSSRSGCQTQFSRNQSEMGQTSKIAQPEKNSPFCLSAKKYKYNVQMFAFKTICKQHFSGCKSQEI